MKVTDVAPDPYCTIPLDGQRLFIRFALVIH